MSTEATTAAPTKKRSLFEIGERLLEFERLLESLDGDIGDDKAADALCALMDDLATDQAIKCDNYVNLIRKWENEAAAAKAEAEQYRKIAQVRANRVDALKKRLKEHMEATHQKKIETATGRTIAIQNNGGVVPLHISENVDPVKLDPRFQKITIEVDPAEIRKALDNGEKLAFAELGQRGTSLRIK